MPRRQLLTPAQRAELLAFPELTPKELTWHYTLSEQDFERVSVRRRSENRLGFALQLLMVRHLGRTFDPTEKIPPHIVAFVATQLQVAPGVLEDYACRDETRREHIAEILSFLAITRLNRAQARSLARWLLPTALQTPRGLPLVEALIVEVRRRSVLPPPLLVLERLAASVLTRAMRQVHDTLTAGLDPATQARLDALLVPEAGRTIARLTWLRQASGRTSSRSFERLIEKLTFVRELNLDLERKRTVHRNWVGQLAREGKRLAAHHLQDLEPKRRYATLVAALLDLTETLTDEALELHDRLMQRLFRQSEHRQLELQREHSQTLKASLDLYTRIGKTLIQARETGQDPFMLLDSLLPWETFVASILETAKLVHPQRWGSMSLLRNLATQVRRYAPTLLENFAFHAAPVAKDLLEAVTLLRKLKTSAKRKIPLDAPTSFIRQNWLSYVFPDGLHGRTDPIYYELCVLFELRNALRSGDIWVLGSRRYQNFEDYLLPQALWTQVRMQATLAVKHDFASYWQTRNEELKTELNTVNVLLDRSELPDVRFEQGELVITPLSKGVPEGAKALSRALYRLLPSVKITELLLEVDAWTGFTNAFTHLRTGLPCDERESLLSVILADGINLGLTKMAASTPQASHRQLSWVSDWFVRDDTYSGAIAELTNYQHALPLARSWGDGTTSSSDGQRFPSGHQGRGWGTVNARYGSTPGATYYTHLSDRYAPYYTQVISTTKRDATFVLDGLLYHEAELSIEEHYTDTAGFTEHVFALCHLLGFRFAPRIRDLGEKRLFIPAGTAHYSHLASLIGGTLDVKHLQAHWDEVLRLAASIRKGTVTASLMIAKLNAYPRQNGLAVALRELGRMERTLFTLKWLQSPELRRRVLVGLNKGEARNALAEAVHFNRRGEAREKTMVAQLQRASGLNLLVAAIGIWNTVYLQQAIDTLREQGVSIDDDLLQHISPLAWEHIGLTGDYLWQTRNIPKKEEYRLLND